MGRLQRKKTTKKKKTRKATDTAGSAAPAPAQTQSAKSPSAVAKPAPLTRSKAGGGKAVAAKREPNLIGKGIQFLREVKVELKKVTWPSRKQTIGSTVVVIILVMIISFFLGAVDIGLSSILRAVL
jgi:preprotein translocase subunit SecE